ncbi:MAG TPA: polyhydroxyalkanoate synthesis regulator DNA-binding domain-containing protein [Polyangiaceae bacterium]|nr:polyhydroxyalkanoate synthesis regulator DNA-binding domain-containing protein [Polyangiaceae bacterium]
MADEAMGTEAQGDVTAEDRRVIKRYSNRKLYDTKDSRYVTLLQIADMVRAGEDVQIIDNSTKEDKTDVTLALIISEELKARPRAIPLATLKVLIRHRGERLLTQLRDSPVAKFMPGMEPDGGPEEVDMAQETPAKGLWATLEQWQHAMDERIRAVLPNFSPFRELQTEIRRLAERVDALERKVQQNGGERRQE